MKLPVTEQDDLNGEWVDVPRVTRWTTEREVRMHALKETRKIFLHANFQKS